MISATSSATSEDDPDLPWMRRALALARHGMATTTPNPRVGCVLVKDGQVVGEGWHVRAGEAHAEVHALRMAGAAAFGSTAYVTLEPCSHVGRTGPCCEALMTAGVTRVVAAMEDPNPLVAGRGLARLRASGIEVRTGVLESAARELNPGFIARMTRGTPWIRLKIGQSLDGRTALGNGRSQWITGAAARADVHRLRSEACAVLTGIGTVRADDPQLTVRAFEVERQPLRVLCDARLAVSVQARILGDGRTLILALEDVLATATGAERAARLRARGVEVIGVPADPPDGSRLDLAAVLAVLGAQQLNEVLVEAGATLNGALLRQRRVDELVCYVAPSLLGDGARGAAAFGPLSDLATVERLQFTEVTPVGEDLRITARPAAPVPP